MQFIQAYNYTKGPRTGPIKHLVIHDMEAPEKGDTAENVARWFADPKKAPQASPHYCCDNDSTVQCVTDADIAWHAPGANSTGIGIELAGYAKQGRTDWLDGFSKEMIDTQLIPLLVAKCKQYKIPPVHLYVADLKAGKPGIVGHVDVTHAYPGKGDHTDPGPGFPWDYVIAGVKKGLTA